MILVVYRRIDRRGQSFHKMQQYAAELRADLSQFVGEKEAAVRDYAISLDVQQKSAKELMRRLQMSDEEFAHKAAAVAKIDERLNTYDSSLEELVRMTVRVQENLNRIRDESAFVEKVNKRVGDSKEKFEAVEAGLGDMERRFQEANAEALERTAVRIIEDVKTKVDDLYAVADLVERRVGDSSTRVAQELDHITRTLEEAMGKAVAQADKMEDAALMKLREEAIDRVRNVQAGIEEELAAYQENAKTQIKELEEWAVGYKEAWQSDAAELEIQFHSQRDEWKKDAAEINGLLESQREAWERALEEGDTRIQGLLSDLKTISDQSREQFVGESARIDRDLEEIRSKVETFAGAMDMKVAAAAEETEQRVSEATREAETNTRQVITDLESYSREIKDHFTAETDAMEDRLKELAGEIDRAAASLEKEVSEAARHIEEEVLEDANARLAQWEEASREREVKALERLTEIETQAESFKARFAAETQDMEARLKDAQAETGEALRDLAQTAADVSAKTREQMAEDLEVQSARCQEAVEAGNTRSRQILADLEAFSQETEQRISRNLADMTERIDGARDKIDELSVRIESAIARAEEEALSLGEKEREKWRDAVEAEDAKARETLLQIEAALVDAKQQTADETARAADRIQELYAVIEEAVSQVENKITNAAGSAEEEALSLAERELEKWKAAIEAEETAVRDLLSGMETALADTKQQAADQINAAASELETLRTNLDEDAARIETAITKTAEKAHEHISALSEGELEKWKDAVEFQDVKMRELLSNIETSLTDTKQQVSDEIDQVAGQLEGIHTKLEDAAAHIQDEITNAIDDAQKRASLLAEEELNKWKKAAEERDTDARQVLSDLESAFDRTKQQASHDIATITGRIEALQNETAEIASRIETEALKAVNDVIARTSIQVDEERENWKQAAEAEGAAIKEAVSGLETALNETKQQAADQISGVTRQIEALHADLAETTGSIREITDAALRTARDQAAALADEERENWKQAAEAEETKMRYLLDSLESALNEAKQQIADEIRGAAEQFEGIQTKIRETADQIEEVMAETMDNAEAQALALSTGELEKWKDAVETERIKVENALTRIEKVSEDTEQRISDKTSVATEQLEALETKINEMAEHIKTVITEAVTEAEEKALVLADTGLEKWRLAAEDGDRKARTLFADLETASAETKQYISNEITVTTESFENIQTKIQEIAAHIEEVMAQAANRAEETALALTDTGLERWKQAAEDGDAKARQLFADLEQASAGIKQQVFDEIEAAHGQLEDARRQREETAARIEAEMVEAVAAGEKKAAALADAGLEKWNAVLGEMDAKTRRLIFDLNNASEEGVRNLTDLEQRLVKISENTERKAMDDAEKQFEACKQAVTETETTVRQAITDLESSFMTAKTRLFDEIDRAETKMGTIQNRIDHASALLDNEMTLAVEKAKEKALVAAEAEDDKVRGIIADLESSFMAAKTRLFDEIDRAETEMGTIQNQINETSSRIDNAMAAAVGNAETQAAALADAGLEKWKAAIDQEDAKIRQILLDLDAAATENEQKMSGLEQRLVKITGNMEQRVLAVTDERLEEWKIITAEAESHTRQLLADLEAAAEEIKTHFTAENAAMEMRLKDMQNYADSVTRELKTQFDNTAHSIERQALEDMDERLKTWKIITTETETNTRQLFTDLEAAAEEIKTRSAAENAAMKQELKDLQGYADSVTRELKAHLDNTAHSIERQALEDMDERLETWKAAAESEDAKVQDLLSALEASSTAIEQRIKDIRASTDKSAADLEARLGETVKEAEQKILAETDAKLEEYRTAQAEQFKRLESLADDTSEMDAELRRYMAEIESRTREAVSRFEHTAEDNRTQAAEAFDAAVRLLKTELAAVEEGLSEIKTQAYQNVSEQFNGFESDFSKDIAQRSDAIERRLIEWEEALETKLADITAKSESQYQSAEVSLTEDLRNQFAKQHERFVSDLERLKIETGNFEEGIRDQMKIADDSLASLKDQMRQDIEEARNTAESSVKAELGRYALSMSESLKQSQRELEAQIKKAADQAEARNHEIDELLDSSRQRLDRWQAGFTAELQKLDSSMNDARKRAQELVAESDERLSSIRSAIADAGKEASTHRAELFTHIDEQVTSLDSAIKEADRHIKDFTAQTRLFERTDELKVELERRLEDLRGDFDRIDQRRAEAVELEGQFIKIKRLEDEVNAKMTRFLSEKHRIEQMENEFSRLLQVSGAVEEKLSEVSNSDDTLQAMQIQIRRLNDALDDAEEKYQRIEKKNQILDTTSDGIDRNFKSLQDSEKVSRGITEELSRMNAETASLRVAVQSLSEENARAKEVADKLSLLDTSLSSIEERIEEMQKARNWLARAETRLEELNKQSLEQVKLLGNMKNPDKTFDDRGAPPLSVRENVLQLAKRGWTVDEIARAVKIGRGEVELILELMPKD
jgi:DNA repair exonuclease SbcCD ATPase subunit